MIFKSLFAQDGLVNNVITAIGFSRIDWFQNAWAARWVITVSYTHLDVYKRQVKAQADRASVHFCQKV